MHKLRFRYNRSEIFPGLLMHRSEVRTYKKTELLVSLFNSAHIPALMSCTDIDPNCVSYPAIVTPLQQILLGAVGNSIAYGTSIPLAVQVTSMFIFPTSILIGCFLIVAIQATYQLL